VIINVTGP